MIFVDARCTEMSVGGDTYPLRTKLAGFGLTFRKSKKQWRGNASLKALEFLADQSGAVLTTEAEQAIKELRQAAEKRARYMAEKAARMVA